MKQFEHIELREKVLKRIRNALINQTDINAEQLNIEINAFKKLEDPLAFEFAKNFTSNGGFFYYADNKEELKMAINSLLQEKDFMSVYCGNEIISDLINTRIITVLNDINDISFSNTVITECDFLCARSGSILLSSFLSSGRRGIATNNALIVVAEINQIVSDVQEALQAELDKYSAEFPSLISFVSGPSCTTDIEQEKIVGALGSKEIYLFLHE
ncbi:MAG: LUD domain-containing protein [Bacteroidales bacterium]|jgi:L-lactate dehydrogenase complex protein LldG|nr:LUD domain-containing protein [Bacteroidales bacterium]